MAVHVPDAAAVGALNEEGRPTDAAEGAHGRIDAAGNQASCPFEQLFAEWIRFRDHDSRALYPNPPGLASRAKWDHLRVGAIVGGVHRTPTEIPVDFYASHWRFTQFR